MPFHIVLIEPEIPANTGNIARTCLATGAHLHLVRPLGFKTDDASLKRASIDYWHQVNISYYDSFQEVVDKYHDHTFYMATTKAEKNHSDFTFKDGDFFVFGKESAGLPASLLAEYSATCMRMPMIDYVRSLNLANSVAIVVYEAWRQIDYKHI